MSAATGLGLLDVAIIEACGAVGAIPDRAFVKCQLVLDEVYASTGIGPGVACEPLYDLARPWVVHLRLLDVHGNLGSPDGFDGADPRYTECRLTPLGTDALASERGERGPLPIGLVNGDLHAGGRRPPFDPVRVADAIERADRLTDDELAAVVGPPVFPWRCTVDGDAAALARGERVDLIVSAPIEDGSDALVVTGLPPGSSTAEVAGDIASLVSGLGPAELGIRDVSNRATSAQLVRLVIELRPGADRDVVRSHLLDLWSLRRPVPAELPEPVAATIRRLARS